MGPGEGQVQRLFDDIVEDELGRDDRRHVRDAGLSLHNGKRMVRGVVNTANSAGKGLEARGWRKGSMHGAGERVVTQYLHADEEA